MRYYTIEGGEGGKERESRAVVDRLLEESVLMFGVGCENGRLRRILGVFDGDDSDVSRQQYVFRPPATCHGNTQPGTPALGGLLVGYMSALVAGGIC